MRIEEFDAEKRWWGGKTRKGRKGNDQAWKVSVKTIIDSGFNLDIKNPNTADEGPGDPYALLAEYKVALISAGEVRERLKAELAKALEK